MQFAISKCPMKFTFTRLQKSLKKTCACRLRSQTQLGLTVCKRSSSFLFGKFPQSTPSCSWDEATAVVLPLRHPNLQETQPCAQEGRKALSGADTLGARDVRFGRARTVSFESLRSKILSEIIKILLAYCRNSSEIQKFDGFSTVSTEFGEIP